MADFDLDKYLDSVGPGTDKNKNSDFDLDSYLDSVGPKTDSNVVPYKGPLRKPAQAIHQMFTGVHNVLGLPGAVEQFGAAVLPSTLTKPMNKLGTDDDTPAAQLFPTPQDVANYSGMGIENRPDLAPQSKTEGYLGAAARAVPNALTMFAGGLGAIPAVVTSVAGEAGAEYAHQEMPDSKWAPIVGGLIGTLGAGGIVANVERAMVKSTAIKKYALAQSELDTLTDAAFAARNPDLKAVANSVGVDTTSNALAVAKDAAFEAREAARITRDNIERASIQKRTAARAAGDDIVASVKNDASALTSEADKAVNTMFDSTANSLGPAKTLHETGEELQSAARAWKTDVLPAKLKAVADPLDAAVPGDTLTPLRNFQQTLNGLNKRAGSLQGIADEMTDSLPKMLAKKLEARAEAIELGGGNPIPSWNEVREIRTILGDAMGNPTLMKGISQQNISALYRALSSDLGSAAKKVGGDAEQAWKNYNSEATRLYDFGENTLSKIITGKNEAIEAITPSQAAQAMLKDPAHLMGLRAELGEAANSLGSYQLRQGTKAWQELPTESQIALTGEKSLELNQGLVAKAEANAKAGGMVAQAEANAKSLYEQAKANHAELVAAAREDFRTGGHARIKEVREAQKAKAAAQAAKSAEQEALNEAAARNRYAQDAGVREARKRLDKAKEALPQPEDPVTHLKHTISKYIGSGGTLALAHGLGLTTTNPLAATAMTAAGYVLPWLGREGKKLAESPGAKTLIPAGVAAGTSATPNALAVPEQ